MTAEKPKFRRDLALEVAKECCCCGIFKSFKCFSKDVHRKDGLHPLCRECKSKRSKAWYRAHLHKNRESKRKAGVIFRQRHPDFYRNWYRHNAETVAQRVSLYRSQNPERWKHYRNRWARNHQEQTRRYAANWRSHPHAREIVRHHARNYRAQRKGAIGSHTLSEWESLKRSCSYRCVFCGKAEPLIKLTRDHILPISKGGSNFISNIQPLCGSCNSTKHNRFPFSGVPFTEPQFRQ